MRLRRRHLSIGRSVGRSSKRGRRLVVSARSSTLTPLRCSALCCARDLHHCVRQRCGALAALGLHVGYRLLAPRRPGSGRPPIAGSRRHRGRRAAGRARRARPAGRSRARALRLARGGRRGRRAPRSAVRRWGRRRAAPAAAGRALEAQLMVAARGVAVAGGQALGHGGPPLRLAPGAGRRAPTRRAAAHDRPDRGRAGGGRRFVSRGLLEVGPGRGTSPPVQRCIRPLALVRCVGRASHLVNPVSRCRGQTGLLARTRPGIATRCASPEAALAALADVGCGGIRAPAPTARDRLPTRRGGSGRAGSSGCRRRRAGRRSWTTRCRAWRPSARSTDVLRRVLGPPCAAALSYCACSATISPTASATRRGPSPPPMSSVK